MKTGMDFEDVAMFVVFVLSILAFLVVFGAALYDSSNCVEWFGVCV